jgi:hypothetical protein
MDNSILNILNDDVILTEPTKEEELKQTPEDNEITENVPEDTLTNIPPESKDLILNKEEYAESLRLKLNAPVGISTSPDSNEERIKQNKEVPKNSLAFLKEKLQGILKEIEDLENEEKIIDEEVAGAAGIPGGSAAAIGPATTTEAVAPWKEKIGKFSMFKRKKD